MASYDIKRCPSCQKPYERNFYSGKPKPEEKIRYGSPVKVCPSCGHEFIDRDYREIALEGIPNMSDYKRFAPGTILYTILSCGLALFTYYIEFRILPVIFLLLGCIITGSDLVTYQKRQNHLKKEILASQTRMKDPSYARKLASYGYTVPPEFLKEGIE